MKKYKYEVTFLNVGTTSVLMTDEIEADDMIGAGFELLDLFENLEDAKSVLIKLIE